MPVTLPNTTVQDAYPNPGAGGAQLAGQDVFVQGWFTIANNAVNCEFSYGQQGFSKLSPEFYLAPGTYPLSAVASQALMGIRFKNAVAGKAAQAWGAMFYPNDIVLASSSEFLSQVSPSGGITPPASTSVNIQAVQAGTKSPGQTYTLTCAVAGIYIVEWGCASYSESGLGDTGTIACSVSAIVNFHGSTAGSGGDALDTPITLTQNQVITFTVGGTVTNLPGCWARIIQIG